MSEEPLWEQPETLMEFMVAANFENVVFCQDNDTGLRAVIAIHDTTLGPAAGGCRMWTYATPEDAAIDAMRLARGMTYKYAAAGVNLGGGKCVVMGDPATGKSEALFRALGRFIDRLGGVYWTGEDVGTTLDDMVTIRQETPYVITLPQEWGGSGPISGMTALGVLEAMRTLVKHHLGQETLRGLRVNVQGAGSVGTPLIELLLQEGAEVRVADVNASAVRRWQGVEHVAVVDPEEILYTPCDILAPCALGGVVREDNVERLNTRIICGSANNQLWDAKLDWVLKDRGIAYGPDFIVNAGGAIFDADRLGPGGFNAARAERKVREIGVTMDRIWALAQEEGVGTFRAAELYAERRIRSVGAARRIAVRP
jgi:leucine dehydrogenase